MIKILRRFLGDKATRDLKTINPLVKQVHEAYKNISGLSNDELRAKTAEFKKKIAEHIAADEKQIETYKSKINEDPNLDVEEKEKIWNLLKLN